MEKGETMMLKLGVKRYFRLDVNSLTVAQRQTWYNQQILLLLNSARRVAKTDPTGDRRNTNESASTPRLGGALALLLGLLLVGCDVCAEEAPLLVTNTARIGFDVDTERMTNITVAYVEVEQAETNGTFFFADALYASDKVATNYATFEELIIGRLDAIDKRLRLFGYALGALLAVALVIAITLIVVIFHDDPNES